MANPVNKMIISLIECGKGIASLHSAAKTHPNEEKLKIIHDNVISSIPVILKDFELVQLPSFFLEKAIPKILDKIQGTLVKLKELDTKNASDYERLVEGVNECKSRINTSSSSSSSSSSGLPRHSETPTDGDSTQIEGAATAENPQRDQFNGLDAAEKKCLFSFCLFSAEVEVKKREPIHLWVALDLVADYLDGAKMLAKLVANGYIKRIIQNKMYCNGYKMNQFVHSMVIDAMSISFAEDVGHGTSFSVMDQQQPPPPQSPRSNKLPKSMSLARKKNEGVVGELGTLVLNIGDEDTLQATALEQIFRMKNNIKVLHLGNWQHNPEKYIVVEVETLKGMTKNVGEVTLLSLEGMSGIVELPNSIYKLEKLRVLDLRACPNLESLSEGIDSLKRLTHLDLSECYLLGHFPKGIASLTELRVLKGFVINPEDSQVEKVNRNGNKKQKNASLSASFSELKALEKLIKLTLRTRRNFPTSDDFDTLCAMKKLTSLKISWVWNSDDDFDQTARGRFPPSLKKLELQAAPDNTMLRLLRLISSDTQSYCPEKLYIKGGRIWELDGAIYQIHHVQTVRLRYLAHLRIDWDQFRAVFPKVTQLEVLECPNLVFFPCDENGIWRKFQPTNMVS